MILALAGQFKQLSHEPEKFRWLNGIRTHQLSHLNFSGSWDNCLNCPASAMIISSLDLKTPNFIYNISFKPRYVQFSSTNISYDLDMSRRVPLFLWWPDKIMWFTSRCHGAEKLSSKQTRISIKMATLSIASLLSFFSDEKKSIKKRENHFNSDHVEAFSYQQGVVHACMC